MVTPAPSPSPAPALCQNNNSQNYKNAEAQRQGGAGRRIVNLPAKGKQDMQDRKRQDMNDLYNFLPCFKIKNN